MKQKLPNIILIVMDTVGAKHMSLYGYHRKTTPNLERLAEESTVYTRCFAPSCWTIPSHASLFTGLYPSQHGAHEGNFVLNPNVQHLVHVLKLLGYRTYGISSNGLVSPASNLCPDFDYFKDFSEGFERWKNCVATIPRKLKNKELATLSEYLTSGKTLKDKMIICGKYFYETKNFFPIIEKLYNKFSDKVNEIFRPTPIQRSSKYSLKSVSLFSNLINHITLNNYKPFFLFINLIEAHTRYRPPIFWRYFSRWYDKQTISPRSFYNKMNNSLIDNILITHQNLYDDELLYLDNIINHLWLLYKRSPISENTIFIITSDHGEHFGEKFSFGHMLSLYNEVLWLPLIIKFPNHMLMSGAENKLVSLTDLYSTVFDLVDSPLPRPLTSLSLLSSSKREYTISQLIYPEIWEKEIKGKENFCRLKNSKFSSPVFAVIFDSGIKIIENRDGSLYIYDLKKDVNEDNDLVINMPPENLTNFRNMMDIIKRDINYLQDTST